MEVRILDVTPTLISNTLKRKKLIRCLLLDHLLSPTVHALSSPNTCSHTLSFGLSFSLRKTKHVFSVGFQQLKRKSTTKLIIVRRITTHWLDTEGKDPKCSFMERIAKDSRKRSRSVSWEQSCGIFVVTEEATSRPMMYYFRTILLVWKHLWSSVCLTLFITLFIITSGKVKILLISDRSNHWNEHKKGRVAVPSKMSRKRQRLQWLTSVFAELHIYACGWRNCYGRFFLVPNEFNGAEPNPAIEMHCQVSYIGLRGLWRTRSNWTKSDFWVTRSQSTYWSFWKLGSLQITHLTATLNLILRKP